MREKLGKGRACWEALPGAEWSSLPPPTVVAMTTEWGRKEERRDHLPLRQWKPIPGHPWPCPEGLGVVRSSGPFRILNIGILLGFGEQSLAQVRPGDSKMGVTDRILP